MKELFTVKRRLTTGRHLYFINRRRVKKSDYERAWLAAAGRHRSGQTAALAKVEQYDDFTGKWQTHSWLFL